MSADGEVSQATEEPMSDSVEEAGADDEGTSHRGRRRRRSSSPTFNRSSALENIANLFSRTGTGERRTSLSRRSCASSTRKSRRMSSDVESEFALADDVNERWGYSSGEEDDETASYSSHPLNPFHSKIDYGSHPPQVQAHISLSFPLMQFSATRQTIYVPEEDNTFRFVGYEVIIWRQLLWRGYCAATLGVVGLLGHWFPRVWLRCVVESARRDITQFHAKRLAYPYTRSTVFPVSPADVDGRPQLLSRGDNDERRGVLEDLHVVDYRYSRDSRAPTWTGLQSIQNGLSQLVRQQRLILSGPNIVDIESKINDTTHGLP
ncbi:hypothetical protein P692DRAFT_20875236 [Suillus brevipes Sb2]|nr:hypothetical protein P692DRAFT_20875236 [Suillus brevipes Sb2]